MKAAVLTGVHDVQIQQRPDPDQVPSGHVLIQVEVVGLCGSDVHYYDEGRIGSHILTGPMILGHEPGGVVKATGDGVALDPGAVVAVEPGVPCRRCDACRRGRYNLCPEVRFLATPPIDGAMATYLVHPADFVHPAPGLSAAEAALAEPLSVGLQAVRRTGVGLGSRVAVLGAGPVGLLAALTCQLSGAETEVFDVRESRLAAAVEMGLPADPFPPTNAGGWDVVLECSGAPSAVAATTGLVRPGGAIGLIGLGPESAMRPDGLAIAQKEITVTGVFRYAHTFPTALALLRAQRGRLSVLLRREVAMEDLPSYLERKEHETAVKSLVRVTP